MVWLLTDIDVVLFVERGIRGGLSQCSSRYAQANNKYISSYDPSIPSSYLMYFDINNLYGWAMSEPLPYAGFAWVKNVDCLDAILSVPSKSNLGYIVEVDLEYSPDLHDIHADLPFCPTRSRPPGKRSEKLLATLYNKERYVRYVLQQFDLLPLLKMRETLHIAAQFKFNVKQNKKASHLVINNIAESLGLSNPNTLTDKLSSEETFHWSGNDRQATYFVY
ncbi:PREDICTED: uncharacterized protein LOC105450632 [Wasmannia auropunctata]|uniref:uncharacterized protein LOC105450632 n=1 Tax=Wasmannia auropunctata TaxID=64793 RepID=UPI0005F0AFF9|nr:PREDICTED: uncharacterized protein LOC105450632 [Wasmannia auropunctata]